MITAALGDVQQRLAKLWVTAAVVLGAWLFAQTIGDVYGSRVGEVWGWYFMTTIPMTVAVISTIIGWKKHGPTRQVSLRKYRFAQGASALYLTIVFASVLFFDDPNARLRFLPLAQSVTATFQSVLLITLKPFLSGR